MRRAHRTLRELLADLRAGHPPGDEACADDCLETLSDPERCSAVRRLGEREHAAVEAERRRWDHPSNPSTTRSSTGR